MIVLHKYIFGESLKISPKMYETNNKRSICFCLSTFNLYQKTQNFHHHHNYNLDRRTKIKFLLVHTSYTTDDENREQISNFLVYICLTLKNVRWGKKKGMRVPSASVFNKTSCTQWKFFVKKRYFKININKKSLHIFRENEIL